MSLQKSFIASVGLVLMFVMGAAAVIPIQVAAQTCNCFCTSDSGANSFGGHPSADACRATCALNGEQAVVCAASLAQSPDRGPRCFSKAQCDKAGERRKLNCIAAGGTNCDISGTTVGL